MRPWERKADTPLEKLSRASLPLDEFIRGLNLIFEHDRKYWVTFGASNPGAFQFNLNEGLANGESDQSWYIFVDATGAKARRGHFDQARCTWTSNPQTLQKAFVNAEDIDYSKIKIDGDFQLLSQILNAVSKTRM